MDISNLAVTMKRSLESDSDVSDSEHEEDEKEEPRIQDVLSQISNAVPYQAVRDLLHSMAASKYILFWSPNGEMILNKRRMPNTSIADLVEYVLLPHNKDVPEPKALHSFSKGLARLEVDKKLIRNKPVLSEVIRLENNNGESSDEETSEETEEDTSGEEEEEDDENDEEEEGEDEENDKQTSEEEEEEEGEDITNSDNEEDENQEGHGLEKKLKHPCPSCEGTNRFRSDVAECPVCLWRDAIPGWYEENKGYTCPICQSESRLGDVYKESFQRCNDCHERLHYNHMNKKVKTLVP